MGDRPVHSRLAEDIDPQQSEIEDLIGYNLKRAYVIVRNDFRKTLGDDGFAPRVFTALSLVVQYPNITQSELARLLGIERSGLVAIIDELQERGFVRRNPVPGDRRVQALSPTNAGLKAFKEALAAVRAHEDTLFVGLTQAERDTLLGLLRKIRQAGD